MAKLSDIGRKIEATIPKFEKLGYNHELFVAQEALVQLSLRVWTDGGVKDVRGNLLKPYSHDYAIKRVVAGYQARVKDLEITGALRRSTDVGSKDGKPAMGFTDEDLSKIAGYQEEQNETKIFQLADNERKEVLEKGKEFVFSELRKITKEWF